MDKAAAARRLGLPSHEVTGVRATPDGDVVTTHDRVQYLIDRDGGIFYYANHPEGTAFPVFGRDETVEVVPWPVLTKAGAALQLGVPESEILDVRPHAGRVPADDGDLVVLADRRVLITRAGVQIPWAGDDPELEPEPTPSTPTPEPEPEPDAPATGEIEHPGQLPGASIAQVLDFVGDDADRARWALEVERAREKPRSGLTEKLERLVTP